MKSLIAMLLAAFALSGYSDYEPNRLGGAMFPKRKKVASLSQMVKQQEENRAKKAIAAAAKENPRKSLKIGSFCGRKFGEKWKGSDFASSTTDKPYFGGYTRLNLKYSPSAGLYSITAINDDTFAIGEVDKEIKRIMNIVERQFNVRFTGNINHSDNREYGQEREVRTMSNSVTGGISGYRRATRTVVTKPATRLESSVSETFKNVRISLHGVTDKQADRKYVEFTVERLPPQ